MKTLSYLLALLVVLGQGFTRAFAQSSREETPVSTDLMKVGSLMRELKKTVVTIETDCATIGSAGKKTIEPHLGTRFLLGYEDERYKGLNFFYLVTSRHVVEPGVENGRACSVAGLSVRLNLKGGNGEDGKMEAFPLDKIAGRTFLGSQDAWVFSHDDSVDLAVIPLTTNMKLLDHFVVASSILLSQAEATQRSIEEGDEVLFAGLFVQFENEQRLEPIVRAGKIAMIPGELIPTTLHKMGTAYLTDTHVFGGNSGSPMFINLGGSRGTNYSTDKSYKLLGIVSGYVKETASFDLQPVASYAGTLEANSGVSMVVPAQQLLDILTGEQLKNLRKIAFTHSRPLKIPIMSPN